SINVVRKALPLNSNLAIAHAAATPKTRLSGTAIAATVSVRRMAASVSGSLSANRNSPAPRRNASMNTAISGSTRNSTRKPSASAIRIPLARGPSVVGRWKRRVCTGEDTTARDISVISSTAIAVSPAAPGLNEVDGEQHREGDDQHDRRDRRRACVVEFFQPDDDQKRRDLRHVGDVAGDEDHRAVFTDSACESEREARQHGGGEPGQDHAADRLEAVGAQRGGCLLDLAIDLLHHRLH